MRVAVVRFEVKADAVPAFCLAMARHAANSLANEPGCLQLDFAADLASPVHFLTYEVFADDAAFNAHLGSQHMAEFRAAVKDLVAGRRVEGYRLTTSEPNKR